MSTHSRESPSGRIVIADGRQQEQRNTGRLHAHVTCSFERGKEAKSIKHVRFQPDCVKG